jgi:hypothetical protein
MNKLSKQILLSSAFTLLAVITLALPIVETFLHEFGHALGAYMGIGIGGINFDALAKGIGKGGGSSLIPGWSQVGAYSIFFILSYTAVRLAKLPGLACIPFFVIVHIRNWDMSMGNLPGYGFNARDFTVFSPELTIVMAFVQVIEFALILELILRHRKKVQAKKDATIAAEAKRKALARAEREVKARASGRPIPGSLSPRYAQIAARVPVSTKRPLPRP